MILKHIAHDTRFFVVTAAVFHADAFGRGDLHVIDVTAVPNRLEDGVGEAEHHDVLHGLFAEIVVDAVHLVFIEHLMHPAVKLPRGLQVGSERLFNDHASAPFAIGFLGYQPSRGDPLDDRTVEIRRRRQVKYPARQHPAVAIEAVDELLQALIAAGFLVAAANVIERCGE